MPQNDNMHPFSEKHPILTSLIGLVLIVIIIWAILKILELVFVWCAAFVKWISSIASSLDAVIIVALISATVSVVSVLFSSIISKYIEYNQKRQEYLYQKREEPYGEFVELLYKTLEKTRQNETYSEEEMQNDINKFTKKLTLWGSNRVIKKWLAFRKRSLSSQPNSENILYDMEEMLYAMRRDLGLRSM